MAGLLINTTDLSGGSYGFYIAKDGVSIGFAPSRRITETIPGIDGELYINTELDPRPISIRGVIIGTSQSDMYTKLLALDALVTGSFNTTPDANFISPTRTEFSVTVPSFGSKKFANCSFAGGEIEYLGPRALTWYAVLTLRFVQSRPFTSTA